MKALQIEYHLLALGLALVVMIVGAGKWSIDSLLAGSSNPNTSKEPRANLANATLVTKG